MKSLLIAVLLLSGVSFADSVSMDNFFIGDPNSSGGYTWNFNVPATATPAEFKQISVLVTGAIFAGGSRTIIYDASFVPMTDGSVRFLMGCNNDTFNSFFCDIIPGTDSMAPLFTGTFDNMTFIPGTYGELTITAVPEGSELAMLGLVGLVLSAAVWKRQAASFS